MIVALLDTNVVVQAIIGSRHSASAKVLDALFAGQFFTAGSPATLAELHRVLSLSKVVEHHGFSQDEIIAFIRAVTVTATIASPIMASTYPDREFLALAVAADAEFPGDE